MTAARPVTRRALAAAMVLLALGSGAAGPASAAGDVDARQADGSTALHWAAYEGRLDDVRRLLAAGADPDLANDHGATPLGLAAVAGDTPIIDALLSAGARADRANAEGETPLMVVARTGRLDAARRLLRAGADVNAKERWGGQTALMWAAAQRQPAMVALLAKAGARLDERSRITDWARKVTAEPREKGMDRGGFAPLHYAAREGCIPCIDGLVKAGADIDLGDGFGATPLILALMNLHFDAARRLVELGADVNLWDFHGQTPLYAAIDVNVVPQGARQDIPSDDTTTALDVARLLIARGANVNARLKLRPPARTYPGDRNGDFRVLTTGATPLMRAAAGCDVAALELLLAHGALVDLPIADGTTPLFATVISVNTRARFKTEDQALAAMRVLKAAGADPQKATGQSWRVLHLIHLHTPDHARVPGSTALMMAVVRDWKRVVRQLAEWGVDLDAADEDGLTALDYAMGRERVGFLQLRPPQVPGMAELLRELGAKVEHPAQPPWPPLSVPQITARVPELLY